MDTVRIISTASGQCKAILQRMKKLGCPAEDIAAVAKAMSASENSSQQNRDRQRRFRAARSRNVTVTLRNVTSENNEQKQKVNEEVTLHEKEGILSYVEPMYVKPMYVEHMLDISKKESKKLYARAREAEFGTFYDAYPHKVGRPAAAIKFAGAIKKAPLEQIMAGLQVYIDTKPADRPWCNPATWLNQERWNDQPAVQPRSQQVSPRLQVILNNRRLCDELVRSEQEHDNYFDAKEMRSLGGSTPEIIPPNGNSGNGRIFEGHGRYHGAVSGKNDR